MIEKQSKKKTIRERLTVKKEWMEERKRLSKKERKKERKGQNKSKEKDFYK